MTEKNPEKSKKGLYRITDNFIRFWFRFVHPYRSYLEIENTELVMGKIKEQFRPNHVSFVYEDICKEWLMHHGLSKIPDLHLMHVGRWWNKDMEIDLLGLSERNEHGVFGECKYTTHPVGTDVYFQLLEKAQNVDLKQTGQRHYVLFSQSGFTQALQDMASVHENIHLETIL